MIHTQTPRTTGICPPGMHAVYLYTKHNIQGYNHTPIRHRNDHIYYND